MSTPDPDALPAFPCLGLLDPLHVLLDPSQADRHPTARAALRSFILQDQMAPLARKLHALPAVGSALLTDSELMELERANADTLQSFDARLATLDTLDPSDPPPAPPLPSDQKDPSEEKVEDMPRSMVLQKRALFLLRIGAEQGDIVPALDQAQKAAPDPTVKIDLALARVRLAIFLSPPLASLYPPTPSPPTTTTTPSPSSTQETPSPSTTTAPTSTPARPAGLASSLASAQGRKAALDEAAALIDASGDWDRRNRLSIYRALDALARRDWPLAANLLLAALPTFNATEIFPFPAFVQLLLVLALPGLPRSDLPSKIINNSDVLSVMPDLPHLQGFLSSLYNADYAAFFGHLATVETDVLRPSAFLAPHAAHYVRRARAKAYAQLLSSYSSLRIDAFARAFNVSPAYIDRDLAQLIAAGQIHASIDRVRGIITTSRPDPRKDHYQSMLLNTDSLLNSLQKLDRILT